MTKLKVSWVIPEEKGTIDVVFDEYFMSLEEWNVLTVEEQINELEIILAECDDIYSYGKLESFEIVE